MVIPATLDQAVDALLAGMDSLDREAFLASPDSAFHHGWGRSLRNEWLHPEASPLAAFFESHGIHHADDSSACLFRALRCRLKREPFDLAAEAEHYREYWADQDAWGKTHPEGGTQIIEINRKTGEVRIVPDEPRP